MKGNGTTLAPIERAPLPEVVERILVGGDIGDLTTEQRIVYYHAVCEAAGVDARARPFAYISLKGRQGSKDKLTLYALKACTDQLTANRKLSVAILSHGFDGESGLYQALCRVTFPDGQQVEDLGAVWVLGLQGEDLANAVMKAITKAKRRTILSACGLGMLDETEVETIPSARVEAPPAPPQKQISAPPPRQPALPKSECREWMERVLKTANDDWANTLKMENKSDQYEPLFRRVDDLVNSMMDVWIEINLLKPEAIETDGKRDKAKMANYLKQQWNTTGEDFILDVKAHLYTKQRAAAAKVGINLDAEPVEAQA